tara:strand:- start:125 stop:328 length:204 start_codon:yes stop_codon:yes gene_type:complete
MSKLDQLIELGLTEKDIELIIKAVNSSALSDSEKYNLSFKLQRIEKDIKTTFSNPINPKQMELFFED